MRKNTVITQEGKKFITQVVALEGDKLLQGTNGPLPFSDDGTGNKVNKTWVVNATASDGKSLNVSNLAQSLIDWFQKYGDMYELDPNILAAQAYVESGYRLWYYSKTTTASGLLQFKMLDIFSLVINNFGAGGPLYWSEENLNAYRPLSSIVNGLEQELAVSSYEPDSGAPGTKTVASKNRAILHQNIIDNPQYMIKAQARYMRYFAENCGKLASTSLLCFRAGAKYATDTYSRSIEKLLKDYDNDVNNPTVKNALDYVLTVWGVLGDKNNRIFDGKIPKYKPQGYYFSYDDLFKTASMNDLSTYPNENFDPFAANVTEADEYGIIASDLDNLSIARDSRYKFIYFPSDQYFQGEGTSKEQIVLHHTVSGDKGGVGGDIKWWRDKGERVATSFIIARDGGIYQLFNTNYWAHHLGITSEFITQEGTTKSNKYLNQHSIGIEIDSWGGLKQGKNAQGELGWYPTIMFDKDRQSQEIRKGASPVTDVTFYNEKTGYPRGFRGFYAFETYTQTQIDAVRDLILSLVFQSKDADGEEGKFPKILLNFNEDIWNINYNYSGAELVSTSSPDGAPDISKNAMDGKSGIWTHTSYRADKSDCHPQLNLIKMLQNLQNYRSKV
jgi:N-acetyl-anhydromuramyl-L-alanine amidase AmpD